MALSNWELVERELAEIFSLFVGTPVFLTPLDEPAMRAYGSIASFSARNDMVEAAAKGFFHKSTASEAERKFRALLTECKGFAARRNDIAHGRVEFVLCGENPWWEGPHAFLLLPGLFATKKYTLEHKPVYVYSTAEISFFSECFVRLSGKLKELKDTIFEVYASS